MADEDLDRSEQATPYKLGKAREQGQVAKSADLTSALVFATAAFWTASQGWAGLQGLSQWLHASGATLWMKVGTTERVMPAVGQIYRDAAGHLLPFFGGLLLVSVLANLLQTGPVLAWKAISPDWTRINPMQGFKRMLSVRTLIDAVRSALKLTVLAVVLWATLAGLQTQFKRLAALPPQAYMRALVDDVAAIALRLAAALVIIGLIDWAYARREFHKKMRMSRRELTDEVKQREGDPRIRARLRELRQEMLKRVQSVGRTKEASVVVTNPTHIAVALKYEHGRMVAPQLVAKGTGLLAAQMRLIAARHGIPVIRSPQMARALHREVAVDAQIPRHWYGAVARLMIWIHAMKQRSTSRNPA